MTQTEQVVGHLLLEVSVVVAASRVVAAVAKKYLGQTDVAGEILAGLLLGPSLLGAVAPDVMKNVFHSSTSTIFMGLAQVGLVLLMFQVGLEFNFRKEVSLAGGTVVVVSLVGILLPFTLGYFSAPWFWQHFAEPRPSEMGFRLLFAIAMSITAVPILGRIFMELGLSHTRTAALVIGSAAIDDVVGWLLLGGVSAYVTSRFDLKLFSFRVIALVVFFAVSFSVVRRLLSRFVKHRMQRAGGLDNATISVILVVLLLSAVATNKLGVFAIIGGFSLGLALHEDRAFVDEWRDRMSLLVQTLLLPLFFAYTGLRTDIGGLSWGTAWLDCILVCAIAFVGKFGGAYLAARFAGESRRSGLTIGVCMNTRALMELIALNIGYDLGVLPRPMFTMLVIMAIVSTFIATPLIRILMAGEATVPALIVPDRSRSVPVSLKGATE